MAVLTHGTTIINTPPITKHIIKLKSFMTKLANGNIYVIIYIITQLSYGAISLVLIFMGARCFFPYAKDITNNIIRVIPIPIAMYGISIVFFCQYQTNAKIKHRGAIADRLYIILCNMFPIYLPHSIVICYITSKCFKASLIASTFSSVECFLGCFNFSTALEKSYVGKSKLLFTYAI